MNGTAFIIFVSLFALQEAIIRPHILSKLILPNAFLLGFFLENFKQNCFLLITF